MRVGLDVGSTTIKCVVLDDRDKLIYSTYERHYSHIVEKSAELLRRVAAQYGREAVFAISGSAGMGMAESVKAPFVQEVFATRVAANRLAPGTDVIIELGGEDAKILFLTNGLEVRMNGSCAGGTGAFIDQMATLLKMGADEMDEAAQTAEKTYTIASRCGVFAKSDIQPLINQGAKPADIAKSIYQAVVNQTIAGLAQGRPIRGNILYLGGPLTFSKCLRQSFDETLGVTGTCPENSLLFVALGRHFTRRRPGIFRKRRNCWSSTECPRPTAPSRRCLKIRRSTMRSRPATPERQCRRQTSRRTMPSRSISGSTLAPPP